MSIALSIDSIISLLTVYKLKRVSLGMAKQQDTNKLLPGCHIDTGLCGDPYIFTESQSANLESDNFVAQKFYTRIFSACFPYAVFSQSSKAPWHKTNLRFLYYTYLWHDPPQF